MNARTAMNGHRTCHVSGLRSVSAIIGVRANIHFCPNGERKLFVTRPRQGEKNNNELLQSIFFDIHRVVPDERLLCYPTRNIFQVDG